MGGPTVGPVTNPESEQDLGGTRGKREGKKGRKNPKPNPKEKGGYARVGTPNLRGYTSGYTSGCTPESERTFRLDSAHLPPKFAFSPLRFRSDSVVSAQIPSRFSLRKPVDFLITLSIFLDSVMFAEFLSADRYRLGRYIDDPCEVLARRPLLFIEDF